MNPQSQSQILTGLSLLQVQAHKSARQHGFWEKTRTSGEILGLVQRDVLNASLAVYKCKGESSNLPGFTVLEEELADAIIRLFDFAGGYELRLSSAIISKLQYNINQLTKTYVPKVTVPQEARNSNEEGSSRNG